jgi:drug/metabolite transporter (DMT)-like permease
MRPDRSASLWLVLITLLWGLSFVTVKSALTVSAPFWFLFLRFFLAAAASLLFFWGAWRKLDRPGLVHGLVLSGVLYLGFVFQTLGLQYTSPSKSAFITGVSVVLVPVVGRLFFGTRISVEVALGVLTAFVGLFLLIKPDHPLDVNRGDLLTFACAVVFAFHVILVGRFVIRTDAGLLAALQLVGASLLSLPLALGVNQPQFDFPWSFYLGLFYLAVFCSAFAFSVQIRAQRHVSPSRAALIFALEPVFAAAASVTFYGDNLLWREWLGGGLVVLGVFLGDASVLRSKYGTGRELQRINQCQNELMRLAGTEGEQVQASCSGTTNPAKNL